MTKAPYTTDHPSDHPNTTPAAVKHPKPMASDGEASMSEFNMSGSPVAKPKTEPVDYHKVAEETAKHIVGDGAVMMSDKDALTIGREVEARYVPPPPAPTVLELLAASKK